MVQLQVLVYGVKIFVEADLVRVFVGLALTVVAVALTVVSAPIGQKIGQGLLALGCVVSGLIFEALVKQSWNLGAQYQVQNPQSAVL